MASVERYSVLVFSRPCRGPVSYEIQFQVHGTHPQLLEALPGVKQRGRVMTASWHAFVFANRLARQYGATLEVTRFPSDMPLPEMQVPWPAVREHLLAVRIARERYLDDWPLDFQREALGFAGCRLNTLFHHPTGAGKTFEASMWIAMNKGPALVVTKAAVRVQYAKELDRFLHWRAFVCKPKAEVRKKDRWKSLQDYFEWCDEVGQHPLVTVGWEALPMWVDQLEWMLRQGVSSLVLDESQKGKGKRRFECIDLPDPESPDFEAACARARSKRGKLKQVPEDMDDKISPLVWKAFVPLGNIVESAQRLSRAASRRLLTTATPIEDRVRDLWGQLDLLEPWAWGPYRLWAKRYCDAKDNPYGGIDDKGSSHEEELKERVAFVKHYVPPEVARANLPPKRRQTWYIPPEEQVKPTGGWKKAIKAATVQGHSQLLEVKLAMAASAKRRAIMQKVGECMKSGQKVVVFTARRRDAEELAESIGKLKKNQAPTGGVWCGHGGHSQPERRRMKHAYMEAESHCVLVGTLEAWGTGVDGLQCTDTLILGLLPWTPGLLDQAEGRVAGRHGQDRPVLILFPIAEGTEDEHLAGRLLEKLPAVQNLFDGYSLAGAEDALSGVEKDPDKFAARVLAAYRSAQEYEDDDEDDDY